MGQHEKSASNLVNIIRELVRQELAEQDNLILCQVETVNDDGTCDVYIVPDYDNIIHGIPNKFGFALKQKDYVQVLRIKNQLSNSFILCRAKGNLDEYNTLFERGTFVPGEAPGSGGGSSGGQGGVGPVGPQGPEGPSGIVNVNSTGEGDFVNDITYDADSKTLTSQKDSTYASNMDIDSMFGEPSSTWELKSTLSFSTFSSEKKFWVTLNSNGQIFGKITISPNAGRVDYGTKTVYNSTTGWDQTAFRTLNFAAAPEGELLAWLQANKN